MMTKPFLSAVVLAGMCQVTIASFDGGPIQNMTSEAKASIAALDDYPVEDTASARAKRMYESLMGLPESDRDRLGLEVLEVLPESEWEPVLDRIWKTRQEELKEAYDAIVQPKELLAREIFVLKDPASTSDEIVDALSELEEHLSDLDMARDFHNMGGWAELLPLLDIIWPNSVISSTAMVIGTAIGNIPDHQLWVLEEDNAGLRALLSACSLVEDSNVASRLIYALSSALRNSPEVQAAFSEGDGWMRIERLMEEPGMSAKVKVRLLTLVTDLWTESKTNVGSALAMQGMQPGVWCHGIHDLMGEELSPKQLEKTAFALPVLKPLCKDHFQRLGTQRVVSKAQKQLSCAVDGGDYHQLDPEFAVELETLLQQAVQVL
ncbi:unnamed protein product [Chrysoparadoxa australica]